MKNITCFYSKLGQLSSVILTVTLLGTSACGSADEDQADELTALEASAQTLCDKAAECQGMELSSVQMDQCVGMVGDALLILPDPDGFQVCISQLPCSALDSDPEAIQSCLDLNEDTIACTADGQKLHACTNSGTCKDIDCDEACALIDRSFHHCGYEEDREYDVCWCQ